MKILFVAHEGRDGIGTHSAGLRRALPGALGPADELVVRALTGRHSRRGARLLEQQLRLPLAERDADLVHLPDFRPTLLERRPMLLTVHDVCFLDHPEWFPGGVRRYKSALLRLARVKRPAAVVCVSEYTRLRLAEHHPGLAAVAHVIRPGIDAPAERAPDPTGEEQSFLTISTLEPRKNHLGLLAALRRARARGFRLRWQVAGAVGYDGAAIASTLEAADGVDYLGPVGDDDRERLFRTAAFVAVPSFVEGFGLPAGEAMARGVPVVAATGSGLDEVGDAGAAVRLDPSDVDGWAAALLRLEGDLDLRRDLRRRGLAAAGALSWEAAARAYVDVYRAVADQAPAANAA